MDKYLLITSLALGLILGFFYSIINPVQHAHSIGSFSYISLFRFSSIFLLWFIGFLKNQLFAIPIFILRGLSIGFLAHELGIYIFPQAACFIFSYFLITNKYKLVKNNNKEYFITLLLATGIIAFLNVFEVFFNFI